MQGWVMLAEPRLELAADFASLFLTDTRAGAPPYASLYTELSGQFSGQALSRMQERLLQIGYAVKNELAEPADHLAVILDYLAARCAMLGALNPGEISADAAAEAETLAAAQVLEVAGELPLFLEQELLSWMPQFTARCQQVSVVSDFYPALAALTEAYLHRLPLSIRQEWLSQPSP